MDASPTPTHPSKSPFAPSLAPGDLGRDPRESAALTLRADGATIGDIAEHLGVKISTAARLVRSGIRGLGVATHAELVAAVEPARALSRSDLPASLTRAEREVAWLVVEGASNGEIARQRRTAERTVANQLQAIYTKLGVGSRRELVTRLLRG
jgi:DNA-binding CsgD family transcriptional regulator